MIHTGRSALRAVRTALRGIGRTPLIQLVSVLSIGLTLMLAGTLLLVAHNISRFSSGWTRDAQLTVYLEDGLDAERTRQIATMLTKLPGVRAVHTVSQHDAYERLRRALGSSSHVLDGVEEAFLPVSIEVALKPGVADMIRVHPALDKLRRVAGVEEVEVMGEWVARLERLRTLLERVALGLTLLVIGAALWVITSTIRLGVFARRDEIEILKLVGATDRFVRAPFLVEGTLQGLAGAALALVLSYGLYRLAGPYVSALLDGSLAAGALEFFSPRMMAVAIALGGILGATGSSLAFAQHRRA